MAIGNSVGDEIREERRKAMGRMSPKEKFAYFWDYYKIHAFVTVAVVIAASSFIYQYATYKDYGFYAALINAGVSDVSALCRRHGLMNSRHMPKSILTNMKFILTLP